MVKKRNFVGTSSSDYLTVRDIAEQLTVNEEKVRSWILTSELRAIDVRSKGSIRPRWRIPLVAFQDFLEGRTN